MLDRFRGLSQRGNGDDHVVCVAVNEELGRRLAADGVDVVVASKKSVTRVVTDSIDLWHG